MMLRLAFGSILAFVLASNASAEPSAEQDPQAWPEIQQQHRPWTRWWWMGSAVDAQNLTAQLESFQRAGLGGVQIVPIYGAKGAEDRYLSYLSPQWMSMLKHTVREAQRFGMGVDMTTGTGWCFGGPSITDDLANAFVQYKIHTLKSGAPPEGKFAQESTLNSNLQAIIAYSDDGQHVDLTDRVGSDGAIEWVVPEGKWQLMTVWQKPMRSVKRAAPGGAGRMLNTFYRPAIETFLKDFATAFDDCEGLMPRGMFHDSYEYQCNWAPHILSEFEKRRGYKLQGHLLDLLRVDEQVSDSIDRVRADYNRTIAELMLSDFLDPWVEWCNVHHMKSQNQAHGSPGNLLDLYAMSDTPETEMFRLDRDPLVAKFASSAAHVAGRKLVASETGTWLREHFHVTLADLKQLVDELFVSGINHVFYHGTCYSPADAKWPGWLFYASTQMNSRNSIWRDVPALNKYIARCQTMLQGGKPDNDVLLYWPIEDYWHSNQELAPQFTVHHVEWFGKQAIGTTADMLWQRGYAFDYISDTQVQKIAVDDSGAITSFDSHYKVLVVPPCKHMPLATIRRLLMLADDGAKVIFEGGLPTDVPGLAKLETRQTELRALLSPLQQHVDEPANNRSVKLGQGSVWIGPLAESLHAAGIPREEMVDLGIKFIRRKHSATQEYFVANFGDEPIRDWVTLSRPARSVIIMDPMSGDTGRARTRFRKDGQIEIYMQLAAGESLILRAIGDAPVDILEWQHLVPTGDVVELASDWRIDFIEGGPSLPETLNTSQLKSWTELGGAEAQRFAGTARYSIAFDVPEAGSSIGRGGHWRLDLGDCRESARVSLNGHPLGTLITKPFHLEISADLLRATGNKLEVEVTNLATNRIADLDRRGIEWKKFHDANIVNIDYQPLDASEWPVRASGLLGPLTLQRLQADPALENSEDVDQSVAQQTNIPLEWIDPDTGFRVVRLSRREGKNFSFYFHNKPFVPALRNEGDKMVFHGATDNGWQQFTINLKTLVINQVTDSPGGRKAEIVAPKSRQVFFQRGKTIFATHVDTGATRQVAELPEDIPGEIKTINADETVLAGGHCQDAAEMKRGRSKGEYVDKIFSAKPLNTLFTVDLVTGEAKKIHEINTWLGHWQFSPTDPKLLMYCHEGPWHENNRIWLIDVTTSRTWPIRQRTVDREIWGHEWWGHDGRTIWFDLQVPRGETFFLAGYDLQSQRETKFSLTRNEWSTHYNQSYDLQLFAGDGGKRNSVARAKDGKWIYLFKPDGDRLRSTRLVNMEAHNYAFEPNVHFSPDGRWVIFRSNMHGPPHIYAVDLTSVDLSEKLKSE